jgi:hypothetical protein
MQEAQVDRHERLLAAGDPPQIEALWQHIHDRVFMQAIPRVPWKDNADAWYGPSAAVWNTAWNAALVGIPGSLGIDLDQVPWWQRWRRNGGGCAPVIGPACTSGNGERPRSHKPLGIMLMS